MTRSGAALLADVGGTRARFARLGADGRPGAVAEIATADHRDFESALAAYLRDAGVAPPLDGAAICAAGPVRDDGSVRLTNRGWTVSPDAVARATGAANPIVVNDFAAVAHALPALGAADRRDLGGGPGVDGAPIAVLGPGTGLGVAALLPLAGGGWRAVEGEGGHVDLAPANGREWRVVERLHAEFGHASAERAISGAGLANVYAALAAIDGAAPALDDPAAIARAARDGADARAAEAIGLFTDWLGAVAGDLALTLGARGGVYVAGGIVPAWGDRFDAGRFRARFEAKGRYRGWLAEIPTWVVTHPHPGLLGLARLVTASG